MRYVLYVTPAKPTGEESKNPAGMNAIVGMGSYQSDKTARQYLVQARQRTLQLREQHQGHWLGLWRWPAGYGPMALVHSEQL